MSENDSAPTNISLVDVDTNKRKSDVLEEDQDQQSFKASQSNKHQKIKEDSTITYDSALDEIISKKTSVPAPNNIFLAWFTLGITYPMLHKAKGSILNHSEWLLLKLIGQGDGLEMIPADEFSEERLNPITVSSINAAAQIIDYSINKQGNHSDDHEKSIAEECMKILCGRYKEWGMKKEELASIKDWSYCKPFDFARKTMTEHCWCFYDRY